MCGCFVLTSCCHFLQAVAIARNRNDSNSRHIYDLKEMGREWEDIKKKLIMLRENDEKCTRKPKKKKKKLNKWHKKYEENDRKTKWVNDNEKRWKHKKNCEKKRENYWKLFVRLFLYFLYFCSSLSIDAVVCRRML